VTAAGRPADRHHRLKLVVAFAIIYVVWGSTFLATRLGVRDLPPMLFAAGRSFLAAGLLLVAAVAVRDRFPRGAREWFYMVLLGQLMITFSNGLNTIVMKHLPSNETALLTSSLALWMAGLGAIGPKGHPLTVRGTVGLLLGLAGVALLMWPRDAQEPGHLGWQLLVIVGGFSWSVGTILYRDAGLAVGPLAFNAMIMLFGACGMLFFGAVRGELPQWHWEPRGIAAMAYLAVFGSAVAYTAYSWLIKHSTTDRVATFAYVNPAVATVLGWAVLGEVLGPLQIAGTLVILLGVALVTLPSRVA
jgi:drug/metabolite transporter (DMT)-like permease